MLPQGVQNLPDWDLTQEIIFHLKLFHLSGSNSTVLAFQKVMLDFVPLPGVFFTQSNFDSIRNMYE